MNLVKIEGGGYRVGIPIPFPMKYVYCYLFPQKDGYVIIDTGINDQQARQAWEGVFEHTAISPPAVKTIYLTHFHPDHAGLAGWLQQKTGADVYIHKLDKIMMQRVWGEESTQSLQIKDMIEEHGVPQKLSKKIKEHMDKLLHKVRPLPDMKEMPEQVEFAERSWQVIHTPGHSDGLVCFYDSGQKILLSADFILDPITPNISVWPGASQKPLEDYLESLRFLQTISVDIAYTAHGDPISHVKQRSEEIAMHHKRRLSTIKNLSADRNAYEIAQKLFEHRELNPHQWRFAMAETIAHLNYLENKREIKKRDDKNGIYRYEPVTIRS
ncbi:Glyoxylase, beta-lactamase superfamily II [Alteribacillus persepolensis]|uniref:Glyoxylase, beta-lactamase superfamily II n=1 Tax=Alteribacillus persepolensis TaxID=568899 RepID=A0A1G8KCG2_9BACI|nr:MBL fold metallo-hydrolase [Alteribacillus persepolensis]SDI41114.1 Glyoxylase, beta-lactamase superfamily II [Alteribacillus persepolensis]